MGNAKFGQTPRTTVVPSITELDDDDGEDDDIPIASIIGDGHEINCNAHSLAGISDKVLKNCIRHEHSEDNWECPKHIYNLNWEIIDSMGVYNDAKKLHTTNNNVHKAYNPNWKSVDNAGVDNNAKDILDTDNNRMHGSNDGHVDDDIDNDADYYDVEDANDYRGGR